MWVEGGDAKKPGLASASGHGRYEAGLGAFDVGLTLADVNFHLNANLIADALSNRPFAHAIGKVEERRGGKQLLAVRELEGSSRPSSEIM